MTMNLKMYVGLLSSLLMLTMAFFFFLRFYLFIHERQTEREAETEADSMQGARCGTQSRDSRITPWAEGKC